jgi:hypothetical protein
MAAVNRTATRIFVPTSLRGKRSVYIMLQPIKIKADATAPTTTAIGEPKTSMPRTNAAPSRMWA